ncbi:pentatricopeptide repeat-containing protein At5g44230 [Mercurialis annua]|uniref:pentatricopeptide repeat-containing protein At5g44230 n=1 Tax=Mercurialis annua TaxID=3986 RepID=UPI002160CCA6|nr:pentatricopeptide repeat-containing protein At5g44230 [Mercurialis annua]
MTNLINKLVSYLPKQFNQSFNSIQQLETQIFNSLSSCSNLSQIEQVHAHILFHGFAQNSYIITKLVRKLTALNIPMDPYPRSIFNRVIVPNPFLYSAVIRGYSMQGLLTESVKVYSLMRIDNVRPVSFTFTAIFKGCIAVLDLGLARQMHGQCVLIGGVGFDLFVGNSLIDLYVKCGVLECARKLFDEMPVKDIISWTEIIVAYAKIGDMDSARELFDGLIVKDMVVWTAMVTGFSQNAKPKEAIRFFERMQEAGVEVDEVTLIGVISACAQLGAAEYAFWVHHIAESIHGYFTGYSVVLGSALIDMYSKCGIVDYAYAVFEGLKDKNVFSYSSMIKGFAMHGHAVAAINLFNEMVKTEVKPNEVTLIGVLTACVHARMVEEGLDIFRSMENHFGVKPSYKIYTCVVDLLGRAGRLNEAMELIKTMPVEPQAEVWGALLGACRVYRNPDMATTAARHLFELEPSSIGNYVILSNIYASAGRWQDVSWVRKLMREKGLKKNPGCSWIETKKGVIHEFFSGDMTHFMSTEIKQVLMNLLDRLQANGYQPNLSSLPYDLSDEEKRRILMTHSEKLTLAFALISLDPGCTVRIMKNLRICEDCHLFMCGASKIVGREIVVRDNMIFHHFRGGTCSCGNFW